MRESSGAATTGSNAHLSLLQHLLHLPNKQPFGQLNIAVIFNVPIIRMQLNMPFEKDAVSRSTNERHGVCFFQSCLHTRFSL